LIVFENWPDPIAAATGAPTTMPAKTRADESAVRRPRSSWAVAFVALALAEGALCAPRGQGFGQAPEGRAGAPFDITGYWTALITDDWQYRMITPAPGDYSYIPLNAEGVRVADAWDPEADEAAGDACKGYAAPALMRLPTRLRVVWEGEFTLRIDADLGMQTRLLHFPSSVAEPGEPDWQGFSSAEWEIESGPGESVFGSLKVDTTNLRPGYLRKNGVPFSGDTFMTEYVNLITEDNGDQYLVIQTFVDDPRYLNGHFVRTLQFKREPDGEKWNPTPCSAT
jgi:hypothetical protein